MARPKRSEQVNLHKLIIKIARQEIAKKGIDSFSLRAIARRLNITAPAIYNHYKRKEDLIAALIIDAYMQFGDSQLKAIERLPAEDYIGRLRTAGLAYRQWAVNHPQSYLLIFTTPVRGREAFLQTISPAASRSLTALLGILEGAGKKGILISKTKIRVSPTILEQLKMWQPLYPSYNPYTLFLALIIWSRVHGLIMFELGKQYPDFIEDPGKIYDSEIESIVKQYLIDRS